MLGACIKAVLLWRIVVIADSALVIGNKTWTTSEFVRYGPRNPRFSGYVSHLSGKAACSDAGNVTGRIAVGKIIRQ